LFPEFTKVAYGIYLYEKKLGKRLMLY